MDLVKRLEEYRDRERELQWEGTFAQYFEIASKKPEVTRLAHDLIYRIIIDAGALYSIRDCPMHEEPLHLIPNDLRADVEKEFGLYIEGDLCPHCRYMVDTQFTGHIEDVPVKRLAFSEKYRVGVGTFTPSD